MTNTDRPTPRDLIEAPATEAGQRLVNMPLHTAGIHDSRDDELLTAVLAIEAAARDEGRQEAVRLRSALERITSVAQANWQPMDGDYGTFYGELVKAHDVLDEVARPEPAPGEPHDS